MRRHYICNIVGDGRDADLPWTPQTGPYRPAVADAGVAWAGVIPTDREGQPLSAWALVVVDADDHSVIDGMKGVDLLPEAKDARLTAEESTKLSETLSKHGIAVQTDRNAAKDVLAGVGRELTPAFDMTKMSIRSTQDDAVRK